MRVLLVEDQAELAKEIAARITRAGYGVDCVETIEDATIALDDRSYSVALLDRRLPDGDGLSLIARIRMKQPGSRILMLTALDAIDNRIEGLDAGADDYLTKPFNLDEMMARIRASLRRPSGDKAPLIVVGALSFDPERRTAFVADEPIVLLRRELNLLETLVKREGCVVPREALLAGIYGVDEEVQEHALTALASRLRVRLQELGAGVDIHSARGLGYMLTKARARRRS
jgi:two-component system OmpR family response regulator